MGGALAPLGSPPRRGACLCPTIRARSFAALVFSNSRPQNRSAARGLLPPRKGAPGGRCFCRTACGENDGRRARAVRRRSRSARFAAGAPPYSAAVFLPIRRFHFRAYVPAAIKLFRVQAVGSLSGVYSQKCFNRISKNARLWAYAGNVENLSFQQYPYFFQ